MGWFSSSSGSSVADLDEVGGPVELTCLCGEKAYGVRSEMPRRVVCKKCKSPLFLLPRSPYPAPRTGVKKARKGKKKKRSRSTAGSRTPSLSLPKVNIGGFFGSLLGILLFPFTWTANVFSHAAVGTARWVAKPLHLAIFLICLILSVTGLWTYHRWQFDQATRLLAVLPQQGLQFLDEGKIAEAGEIFRKTSQAVATVGRTDFEARKWQQLARETNAVKTLSSTTLEDLVADVSDFHKQPTLKWREVFTRNYQGQWLILDSTALREGENGQTHLEVPFSVNGEQVRLTLDFPDQTLSSGNLSPTRAIFAAQIRDCLSEGRLGWNVTLDPSSVVYLTNPQIYTSLRLMTGDSAVDEETRKFLEQQAKQLEEHK